MESDLAYFRRRASEERTAALEARHADAREAHAQLAARYEDLVRAIAAREQGPELSVLARSDVVQADRSIPRSP
jgi:hypothetical protein